MAKVIVTGGAGFIGSHLVDRLIKEGNEVIIIDDLSTGDKLFINKKAKFINRNICDCSFDLGKGVDYIFHQGALPRIQFSIEQPYRTFQANVQATEVILEMARVNKVKKVIYASSSSVYGKAMENSFNMDIGLPLREVMRVNPETPYATHKYMSELLCKTYANNFNMNVIVLRYFNVYGERMSTKGGYKLVMAIFKEQMKRKYPLTVYGDGKQTRDFTYIDDVVNANILAMKSDYKGYGLFNICSGQETSIMQVALYFKSVINLVDNPRLQWEEQRKVGSYEEAKRFLGYEPKVFIEEGIEKYIKNK